MLSDLHYIRCDRVALGWACGCLLASMNERVKSMIASNHERSRWLLVVEMMACFVPLTIAWSFFLADFLNAPSGPSVYALFAVLGVLGPIGLISALWLIFLRRSISRWFGVTLTVGLLLLTCVLTVAFGRFELAALSVLRDILLIAVLPTLGAAHMIVLGRRESTSRAIP
jgi:hypothetical protein